MTFAPLPKTTHIGHIHLRVTDLDRSASFYCDMLGMRLVQQVPGYTSLSATGDRPALLILHENKNARSRPRGTTGLYHIAIRFPDRAALAQTVYHLFQQQWSFQGAADHKVSEAFYLPDPDGNGLELYSDRPRSEWAWQGDQVAMSTDPLDIDELIKLAESFATPWGGAHPGTDIGHIHLQSSDLDKAEAFYHRLLGLDVTQRSYPGALFFSAGGYHHHVAVNTWAGRGISPAPADAAGLIAFQLDLGDEAARAALLQRLEAEGVAFEDAQCREASTLRRFQDRDGLRIEV